MNAVVISSSSDEEDNPNVLKKHILNVLPKKSPKKSGESWNASIKSTTKSDIKKTTKTSGKLSVIKPISTVILNDDGEDEEYQLDLHTKSRQELNIQKSLVPKPLSTSPSTSTISSSKLNYTQITNNNLYEKPLPKLTPKPIETDIVLTNSSTIIPKPLLPSLTITPVSKNDNQLLSKDGTEMPSYLKVKNIDSLKDTVNNHGNDPIEVNSTLEINQSTNLFILNSDTSSTLLKNVKYVCVASDTSPILSSTIQEAIKLSNQHNSEKSTSPLFRISNVQSLATTKSTSEKRKQTEESISPKRRKLNPKKTSSEVILLDDDETITQKKIVTSPKKAVTDVIALDSDDEELGKHIDDVHEVQNNASLEECDDSQDVICIENNIDKIDICSSDTDNEISKDDTNELKSKIDEKNDENTQNKSEEKSSNVESLEILPDNTKNSIPINDINILENNKDDIHSKTVTDDNTENSETLNNNITDKRNDEVQIENAADTEVIDDDTEGIIKNDSLFEKFLDTCGNEHVPIKCRQIINESIGKIRKRYQKANIDYVNSEDFKMLLNEKIKEILSTPIAATVAFSDVLTELKINKQADDESVIDKKTLSQIKKLETVLRILNKKIRRLELEEMSLEDDWDENAIYLQEERYKKKSCQIYKKLCQLRNEDVHLCRPTLMKINFQESKYPEINLAISKLYNKKREFPNIYDIVKCIKKCVNRHKMKFTETEIDEEAQQMFKLLGNKLQKRRQKETYQNIMTFPSEPISDDPAATDIELDKKLHENNKRCKEKMEDLMNQFVQKQNLGEDTDVNDLDNSEKSDSNEEDSSDSDEEIENDP